MDMQVFISLDSERGLLHPVASPCSDEGPVEEQLGRAADFVTALAKYGSCKIHELESDQGVLEVQLPGVSSPHVWFH